MRNIEIVPRSKDTKAELEAGLDSPQGGIKNLPRGKRELDGEDETDHRKHARRQSAPVIRRENVQMSKQTIISHHTNDAKLTAQIEAAKDTKRYECRKTGSNKCARRRHEQLHRRLRQ